MTIPKAFVSYSWEGDDHKDWVRTFATRLRADNVETTLDQWHAVPGDQLPAFMEKAVRENDFVLVICTPRYKKRSDSREGGVGYEGDIMTAEAYSGQNQRKFIPILRRGKWSDASPSWMMGKYYIDLSSDPYSEQGYQDLLSALKGNRPKPPPLGHSTENINTGKPAVRVVPNLACICDLINSRVIEIEYIGYTFGESRRILDVIRTLHKTLNPRITRAQPELPNEVFQELRNFAATVNMFISEANHVLPTPNDDGYSLTRDYLTKDRMDIINGWDILKPRLLAEHADLVSFEEMRLDDAVIFPLMGFTNDKQYHQFISPGTETMIKNAGVREIALLKTLLERRSVSEKELVTEGFPKWMIVETFNSLMRDSFLKNDNDMFVLTGIGFKILTDLLDKKTSAS